MVLFSDTLRLGKFLLFFINDRAMKRDADSSSHLFSICNLRDQRFMSLHRESCNENWNTNQNARSPPVLQPILLILPRLHKPIMNCLRHPRGIYLSLKRTNEDRARARRFFFFASFFAPFLHFFLVSWTKKLKKKRFNRNTYRKVET